MERIAVPAEREQKMDTLDTRDRRLLALARHKGDQLEI